MVKHDVMLEKIERAGPMPHNGYRVFSTEKLENIVGNIKQETFEKAIRSDFL